MSHVLQSIFPTETGLIHIVGIGGIGMSGIAEILHGMGYSVQGSDLSEGYITEKLEKQGIKIFKEHSANNVNGISYLVKSTAIKEDNPEVIEARKQGIPVIKRAEMLAELMRFKNSIAISGTHGKTTTTSMVAALFEAAGTNPSVINGGIINSKSTNAYLGDGEYLIVEADESDGTFIKVPSYVAVITNIDPEHMDHYGTFDKVKDAFKAFLENLPFYGFGVVCYDHPVAREIGEKTTDRRVLSYGIDSRDVDFRAVNIKPNEKGSSFDVEISASYIKHKGLNFNKIQNLQLGIHGQHNVLNSLAAIAIGIEKKFDSQVIKDAFATFMGVKRRFTLTGEVDGISIIDDYAHHPAEIKVTLNTARHLANLRNCNVIAVMQPHRFTRLNDLMDDFSRAFTDANQIIISDVYSAGELPIKNATPQILIKKIKENSAIDAIYLSDPINLAAMINKLAKNNDLVVLLGAGSITKWAYELPEKLSQLRKAS